MGTTEKFRSIFNESYIVTRWKDKGFDHVGTIFKSEEMEISFIVGYNVELRILEKYRKVELDIDLLNLILETKRFIEDLWIQVSLKDL